jgi:putative ABC transport system ATP-binding protein
MSSVVVVTGLHKHYRHGREDVHALRGVDLAVGRGEFIAIMGASGSGKTTLLHLIGGLDLPGAGSIEVAGRDITRLSDRERTLFRRRRMGIVFQAYNLLPTLTARENIMLPWLIDGRPMAEIDARANEMLNLVHLEPRAWHHPSALSGGEQQRVAIARALLNQPDVLLADEPTGNLDPTASLEIWGLLRRLADETGTTIVMVTHEAAAAAHADRVHVLREGRFVGLIESEGRGNAALVATRYHELAR